MKELEKELKKMEQELIDITLNKEKEKDDKEEFMRGGLQLKKQEDTIISEPILEISPVVVTPMKKQSLAEKIKLKNNKVNQDI